MEALKRVAEQSKARQQETVRLSLDLAVELNERLEEMANEMHTSKSDVLRKAIALMEVAVDAKREGKHFGVARGRDELETEIVGI